MATTASCVRMAFEETPRYEGAPTTAPYRVSTAVKDVPIQSLAIGPAPGFIDRSDELRGIEGSVAQLIDTFEPDGSISVRAYPNLIPWLLNAGGFSDAITAGDGAILDPDGNAIPVGAHRHVLTKRGGLTAKTLQFLAAYILAPGGDNIFFKGQGYGLSSFGMDAAGAVTGGLEGLVLGRTSDPNITPSYESQSVQHFRRGHMTLSWLSGTGETTDFSFAVANALLRRHTYGLTAPTFFPDKLDHDNARVRITGSIPKSSFDPEDYDALVAGTPFAAKAKWLHTQNAAGSYKYQMWLEMPSCQYLAMTPDPLTNARRIGASFDFWAAWDETAGYDAKITVVNSTSAAAFETYV